MKNLIKITAFVLIGGLFFACKKSGTKPTVPTIVGKWRILIDSSYVDGGNVPREWHEYHGTSADFYDFQSDGKLSYYENGAGYDSSSYVVNPNGQVAINY